jgi:hypothetical protein
MVDYDTETQFSILLYLLKYNFSTNHSFPYFTLFLVKLLVGIVLFSRSVQQFIKI